MVLRVQVDFVGVCSNKLASGVWGPVVWVLLQDVLLQDSGSLCSSAAVGSLTWFPSFVAYLGSGVYGLLIVIRVHGQWAEDGESRGSTVFRTHGKIENRQV